MDALIIISLIINIKVTCNIYKIPILIKKIVIMLFYLHISRIKEIFLIMSICVHIRKILQIP